MSEIKKFLPSVGRRGGNDASKGSTRRGRGCRSHRSGGSRSSSGGGTKTIGSCSSAIGIWYNCQCYKMPCAKLYDRYLLLPACTVTDPETPVVPVLSLIAKLIMVPAMEYINSEKRGTRGNTNLLVSLHPSWPKTSSSGWSWEEVSR